jgi:serine/threonine protein kinase
VLRRSLEDVLGPAYRVEREVRPIGPCRAFVVHGPSDPSDLLVKVLPTDLGEAVEGAVFEREVLLVTDRLGYPGIVRSRFAGASGRYAYHGRAFVPGTTLRAHLARAGGLAVHQTVRILRDVLAALAAAHEAGVTHGDLRPEHVILTDGRASVAEFGVLDALARALPGIRPDALIEALADPRYTAPERRVGAAASPGADLFAVGIMAEEMLSGEAAALRAPGRPRDSVPSTVNGAILRCLEPDPGRRWAHVGEMLEALGGAA